MSKATVPERLTAADLTDQDRAALAILRKRGAMTCATLGSELWGRRTAAGGGPRSRMPQHYARPAGRIVRRLMAAGMVTRVHDPFLILYAAMKGPAR